MNSGQFRLPGKKALQPSDTVIEIVVVEVTEQPIERPRKRRQNYSGKKKRHTQKAQVMANQGTLDIIATAFGNGSIHEFRLFKESYAGIAQDILGLGDTGYLGIQKLHPFTTEQKAATDSCMSC